jgi:maltose-binding protein MalE
MNRAILANRLRLVVTLVLLQLLMACGAAPNDFPPRPTELQPGRALAAPTVPPAHPTPPAVATLVPTAPATAFPDTLELIGFYDPQDQAVAAVEFRRRIARFERETSIRVAYDWKREQDVNMIVQTYAAAGVPVDVGPVLPEDVGELVEAGILARIDRLAANQRWQHAGESDRVCVVDGKRYCVVDLQGKAWIIPRNAPNPFGAIRFLEVLLGEQ